MEPTMFGEKREQRSTGNKTSAKVKWTRKGSSNSSEMDINQYPAAREWKWTDQRSFQFGSYLYQSDDPKLFVSRVDEE